jgi:hypothetical protein
VQIAGHGVEVEEDQKHGGQDKEGVGEHDLKRTRSMEDKTKKRSASMIRPASRISAASRTRVWKMVKFQASGARHPRLPGTGTRCAAQLASAAAWIRSQGLRPLVHLGVWGVGLSVHDVTEPPRPASGLDSPSKLMRPPVHVALF